MWARKVTTRGWNVLPFITNHAGGSNARALHLPRHQAELGFCISRMALTTNAEVRTLRQHIIAPATTGYRLAEASNRSPRV